MKVATKAYGLIDVDERQRITFPSGILGFETCREYMLLDAERQPFYWLQSVDAEEVAFILINPFLFRPDYEADIGSGELRSIGLEDIQGAEALIFSIVTIPQGGGPMTANLQGPLVINRETRQGVQAVLTDPRWKTKHDIMAEFASSRRNGAQAAPQSPGKEAPC